MPRPHPDELVDLEVTPARRESAVAFRLNALQFVMEGRNEVPDSPRSGDLPQVGVFRRRYPAQDSFNGQPGIEVQWSSCSGGHRSTVGRGRILQLLAALLSIENRGHKDSV